VEERPNARMNGRFRKESRSGSLSLPPWKKKSLPFLRHAAIFALPFGAAAAACLVVIWPFGSAWDTEATVFDFEVHVYRPNTVSGTPADETGWRLDAAMRGRDNMAQTSRRAERRLQRMALTTH
jgi:hypothetical protein